NESRQEARVVGGSRAPGDSAAQQSVGERHPPVREDAEDQRGDAERRGPALPRYISPPKAALPEARCDRLALSSGSNAASGGNPFPGRLDPEKGCGTGNAIDIAPTRWRNAVGDARLRASQTTGLLRSYVFFFCVFASRVLPKSESNPVQRQ